MLYQFKWDERGDAAGGQFRESGDILLISPPVAIVPEHDGRARRFLPAAPVVANAFRLGTPAAQRILLEAIRVLEAEPIALFVVVVGIGGICISVRILLLRIVVTVAVAIVCSIVVAVAVVVGSAAARTIPLLDGPSSSPIRLRPILIAGPSPTTSTSSAPSTCSSPCFLLLVAIVPLVVVLVVVLLRLLPLWWPLRATPSSVRSVCQLRLS